MATPDPLDIAAQKIVLGKDRQRPFTESGDKATMKFSLHDAAAPHAHMELFFRVLKQLGFKEDSLQAVRELREEAGETKENPKYSTPNGDFTPEGAKLFRDDKLLHSADSPSLPFEMPKGGVVEVGFGRLYSPHAFALLEVPLDILKTARSNIRGR